MTEWISYPQPNRIVFFGRPGSGKSTLASAYARISGLPLYHLDKIRWTLKDGHWFKTSDSETNMRHTELIAEPSWVMDGNYLETLENRCRMANIIVHVEVPRYKCLWRIFIRSITEGINLNWGFIKYVWNYDKLIEPLLDDVKLNPKYVRIRN